MTLYYVAAVPSSNEETMTYHLVEAMVTVLYASVASETSFYNHLRIKTTSEQRLTSNQYQNWVSVRHNLRN